ncbi:hypothetical protein JT359_12880 [Candidatus Poribacteria bacterium]|nr:hypothetical protein [Candidatus Poribacteria bacterium]
MIWKSIIAPLILLVFVMIVIYLSKRDLEDIKIKKKQNSEDVCKQCDTSTQSNSIEGYQSIEYIRVQDIDEVDDSEDNSESNHSEIKDI